MPYLIDGYNVYHTACKLVEEWSHLAPSTFCRLIAEDMQRLGEGAAIVFDGHQPRGQSGEVEPAGYVRLVYSGSQGDADMVICKIIAKNTAPRRLTVVSTDHQIRQAARRRRATVLTSKEYLEMMIRRDVPVKPRPTEPIEKRTGMSSDDVNQWLKIFGIEDTGESGDPTGRTRI